jgi:hypothetical protein
MGLATAPEGELISLGKIFRRGRDPAAVETEKKLTQLHFCFSQVATSKRERFFPQKRIYRTTGSAVLVNEAFDDLMSKGSPMELCEYLEDFLDNHGANNGSGLHRYAMVTLNQ